MPAEQTAGGPPPTRAGVAADGATPAESPPLVPPRPRWQIAPWVRTYRLSCLPFDVLAGLTLAAYAIPVSLAYSSLAGLPSELGLYCYLAGGLAFALLGSSRVVAFGPTSSIAILLGSGLAGLAGGDAQRHVALAMLAAILVAVIAFIAWLLRFGHVASFVSDTVLTGFKAGAAIVIAGTQLPKLLGIDARAKELFPMVGELAGRLGEVNPYALAVGVAGIVLLVVGQWLLPARPVALLVVILSIVASGVLDLRQHGVAVVGELPAGLPSLALPHVALHDVRAVLPLALGCFLLAFIEDISAARTFAERDRESLDANRELLALGAGNLAAALVQGYPAAGGMSQSAVNAKAGARSPLSLVFASLAIGVALLFLTHTLRTLPVPILAAVVFLAVKDMIDVRALRHLRHVNKIEYAVALVSLAGVLVFGILVGLLLAAIFSVVMLLRWAANPHTAVLGRIPGTDRFGDVERHPHNETFPGVLIFRVEGGIFYFNADSVKDQFLARVAQQGTGLGLVIFDLSSSPQVDLAGIRMLGELHDRLAERGVVLEVTEAHQQVRELLRAEGMESRFGKITRKTTCNTLVEEWLARSSAAAERP
ncbi:SulP family inorganic anion transporter [Candidatus Binatia bacterium]|nr:SulP family inorganic anion transporter [Candidatus Binatia bacterium]